MTTPASPPTTPRTRQAMVRTIMKAFTPIHRWVLRASRGRIGQKWSTTRLPLLLLTTTGRRSGEPRTAVVGYMETGRDLIVIASKAGLPEHPAWYYNILVNPEVTVERNGVTQAMRASVIAGEERDRLWADICARDPVFATYQSGISRQIPVVRLQPLA